MWNFKEDLEKWEKFEDSVIDLLSSIGYKLIKNPDKKGIDLLLVKWGIECKMDEYAQYSWNFYIEYECNWKPSWIFKEEKHILKYWAHSDWKEVLILDWLMFNHFVKEKIKLCMQNKTLTYKWYRIIEQGWNGWRTKGLLVPIQNMYEISRFRFTL